MKRPISNLNRRLSLAVVIAGVVLGGLESQPLLAWSWPQCRNANGSSTPEAPASIYLGDQGLTFGHDSWATVDGKWAYWRVYIRQGNSDVSGGTSGTEYGPAGDKETKEAPSPQFTATGTWYWGMRVRYPDAGGLVAWYCRNDQNWNNMYGTPDANLTVTVSPLNNPSDQSGTPASGTQINLSWSKDAQGHNVMIVRNTTGTFTAPTQGAAYSVGSNTGPGGDAVVYNSSGTSTSDSGLSPGTHYYYKFYSENYSYYSAGATANACTAPTIGTDPQNTTVCSNSPASFSVTANGSGLAYQWQVNSGSSWGDVTDGTGGTTASYTTVATAYGMNGYKYRCVVTDSCGTTSVNSGEATLTVDRPPVAQNISVGACAGVAQTLMIIGGKHAPTDPDGDTMTVSGVTQPAYGTVTYNTSSVTYTYTNNAGSYPASDSFTYTISDGRTCTVTKTVSVSVNAPGSVNIVYGPIISNGNFVVRFAGIPGYTFTVQTNSSFSVTGWGKLVNRTAPTDNSLGFGIGIFEVQDPVAGRSSSYYRTIYPSY